MSVIMKKLYKYASPELFNLIFSNEGYAGLKASYPKDFNDPYELFLSIDTKGVPPEILAYYQDIVKNVSQLPTLCFSKHPDIVPMWAHYAHDGTGFVIELDEESLIAEFNDSRLEDMNYSESPSLIDIDQVYHAYGTGKPRHAYFLQSRSFNASYFTKSNYWSYEFERRFVVDHEQISNSDGLMIINIPVNCITALITGPRTDSTLEKNSREVCEKYHCNHYRMRIGRSSMRSFFINSENKSFVFDSQQISEVEKSCTCCCEPIENDSKGKCHWCAITEAHEFEAARRNPMRMLANYGLLEGYMKSMADIAKRK